MNSVQQQNRKLLRQRIEDAVAAFDSVFFVQVGSHDGVSGDPLHPLIQRHENWRGIFVEPVRHVFQRLRANYNFDSRFHFENVAVATQPGTAKFYYVSPEAAHAIPDLPLWFDRLGSFNKQHILKHLRGVLEPFVIEEDVECMTLPQLLAKHGVSQFDLLHIDAEGYDYQILSQIDFSVYEPAIVLFEQRHLPNAERQQAENLLLQHHYTLFDCGADCLAVSRGLLAIE